MRALTRFTLITLLYLSFAGVAALAAENVVIWTTSAADGLSTTQTNTGTRLVSTKASGEFTVESVQSFAAKTGDSFAVNLRLRTDIGTRALPELVCYDAQGKEIPIPSSLARGNPFVTTEWQSFEKIFVVRPGTASVKARVRGTGKGVVLIGDPQFAPKAVNTYETGMLITQPHAKRRQSIVLESNFGIVNRELITREDRDGDGKWAIITIDLDKLTAPAKKGEDWRSGFEDNPNVILWSDGAVLKSDTVKSDRAPDKSKALHYKTTIHPGPYIANISDPGRSVAVSLDGNSWKRFEAGEEIELGELAAADGVVEFWMDACYRDPVSIGPVYFDYVRLLPTTNAPSIEKLFTAARQKPTQATIGSFDEKRIPITVDVGALPNVETWPVGCGLPVPQGELLSADRIAVLDANGKKVPSQNRVTARWPDGSARWIFLDFMHRASAGTGQVSYTVQYGNRTLTEGSNKRVQAIRKDSGIEIDTGAVQFLVSGKGFGILENVRLNHGTTIVQSEPLVAEVIESGGHIWKATDLAVSRLEVEQPGPLHMVILVETKMASSGKPSEGFYHRARIHAFADSPLVEIDYFIANTDSRPVGEVEGSMSSKVAVKSVALKLKTHSQIIGARHAAGTSSGTGATIQKTEEETMLLNHTNSKDIPAGPLGWISANLQDDSGLGVGVADFREQFPKAFRWSPNEIDIDLWAAEGGTYDWIEGIGKTHHISLLYSPSAVTNAEILAHGPLLAVAAPEWYAHSGAMGRIDVASTNVLPRVERTLVQHMKESVIGRVGLGFENYGDHSSGGYVKGSFLWDNNEYDLPAGCMVHFARTGDTNALRIGLASALHYLDVDTIHYSSQHADWARAQHVHSHATFGHHTAQGPDFNHAGYLQGLIWYSYFTGEPVGIEGAKGIADWILANVGVQTLTMERALGHPLMSLNDIYEAIGEEKYLRGAAQLVDQALKWENPVRSGLPSPVTESPAYYSGCPFNAGMTFSALMKFNVWAKQTEIDAMLERLAQWTLTDTWRAPFTIQSKGGSPRRGGQPYHIANHGRLMAQVYERTLDPFYLVVPARLAEAGLGEGGRTFGTRDTGLVYNYLPWYLAMLAKNGNPQLDPKLEVKIEPSEMRLEPGHKTTIKVTAKNAGLEPIESLRFSLHARRDIRITPSATSSPSLGAGQSATYSYEIEAPADVNLSCEYNRVAFAHWSALYQRADKAQMAHQVVRMEFDAEK